MISIKTPQEISIMQQGGKILARILDEVVKAVKPGKATKDLDKLATQLIFDSGAKPAFLGHDNFPAALCVSVNEQIVHGLPSERKLKEGDIIGLDLGILYPVENCQFCPMASGCSSQRNSIQGFYTDMAITVGVGKITPQAAKLIQVSRDVLDKALAKIRPGNHIGDISFFIQQYVEKQGFSVVRNLVGHGIGKDLHEDPEIPNFGLPGAGPELKPGMVLAIEPMVTAGHFKLKKSTDGFGLETEDKSLASHFEYTVAVTKNGCEVLTKA